MDVNELCGILESVLYIAGEPVRVDALAHALNLTQMELEPAIEQLRDNCILEKRGKPFATISPTATISTGTETASTTESEGLVPIAMISAPTRIPGERKNIRSIILTKF